MILLQYEQPSNYSLDVVVTSIGIVTFEGSELHIYEIFVTWDIGTAVWDKEKYTCEEKYNVLCHNVGRLVQWLGDSEVTSSMEWGDFEACPQLDLAPLMHCIAERHHSHATDLRQKYLHMLGVHFQVHINTKDVFRLKFYWLGYILGITFLPWSTT